MSTLRLNNVLLCTLLGLSLSGQFMLNGANWPDWRGPNGDSIATESNFPTQWDQETNIRWKTALPDIGNSSPIVWNDQVFISQAEDEGTKRSLIALRRSDGSIAWKQGVHHSDAETKHQENTYCASSPVTDGTHVYVSYASAGFYCYDMNGKMVWNRNFGPQIHTWGDGSSPVIHEDKIIFFHGPGKHSKLFAIDKKTGKTIWEMDQPSFDADVTREDGFKGNANGMVGSFATPVITQSGSQTAQVVMTFPEWIGGININNGTIQWTCDGLNPLVYASPIVQQNKLIVMGGYFGPVISVQLGGKGDVTKTHRLWKTGRTPHRLGTGVIHKDHIYVFDRPGFLHCMNLQTGETVFEERVRGRGANPAIWGSAILVDDKLYTVNQSGETVIARANPSFELIAINPLGEHCNSTPAFSNGEIFIRTHEHLWCIGDREAL